MAWAAIDNRAYDTLPTLSEWDQIHAGSLMVKLAETADEIEAAQALRYRIFYEEMGGTPSAQMQALKRDFDMFDQRAEHLLVLDDDARGARERIVGTYRLLRRSALSGSGRFYSESEFNLSVLQREEGEILELGRSCVKTNYRSRAVMQLLWRGIGAYIARHDVRLLFGCASLPGTDAKKHALPLSYLYHYHRAPADIRTIALAHRHTEMNLLAKDSIDVKVAFAALPPLIKGYLRAGGYVGEGAVMDADCNTTDVSMIVRTSGVTEKYAERFGAG